MRTGKFIWLRLTIQALALLGSFNCFAQDFSFVNPNNSLLYLNPSFAGSSEAPRIQLQTRRANASGRNNYLRSQTHYAAIDGQLKNNGGIGLNMMADNLSNGLLRTVEANLIYAQRIDLAGGKLKCIPSIQVGIMQKQLDVESMKVGDVPDPRYSNSAFGIGSATLPVARKSNTDLSAGLLFCAGGFYGGISYRHLNMPDMGLMGKQNIPSLFSLHASYNKSIGGRSLMQVFGQYGRQGSFDTYQVSANLLLYGKLMLGLGALSRNSLSCSAGYRIGFATGWVAYDAMAGNFLSVSTGAWSVGLNLNFGSRNGNTLPASFESF